MTLQIHQFPICTITQADLASIRILQNQIERLKVLEKNLLRSLAEKFRAGAQVEDGILTVRRESKVRAGAVVEIIRIA